MVTVYLCIAVWEVLTTPMISHSDTWRGVWISLIALPAAVFWIVKTPVATSRFFVYGMAGSLLFLFRFLNMDRFSLWLEYQAPSPESIVACWILFACAMGVACWLAAMERNRYLQNIEGKRA